MPAVGYLEYWYLALRSSAGHKVRILDGDKALVKQKLYKARADAMDDRLKSLTVTDSPTSDTELWIVHSKEPNGT